jgi:hypothetical protein
MGVPNADARKAAGSPAKRKVIDPKQTTGIRDFFSVIPMKQGEAKLE